MSNCRLWIYNCRFWIVNIVILLAALGAAWGRYQEGAPVPQADFLRGMSLPFRGWATSDAPLSAGDRALLQPDTALVRRYQSRGGASAELAVVAGHRKRTVHTPSYCMLGGGWEVLTQRPTTIPLPRQAARATRMLMTKDGHRMLVTYFFTDGDYTAASLLPFQGEQLLRRFHARVPVGALVRIRVPVVGDPAEAARFSDDFACATVPPVLARLRAAQD